MKNDVMRGTRAPSCFLSFLSLFLKNEKRLLLWRLRTKYGIIKRPSGTMCYPSYNWLNSCLTVWQTLRHFGENDTFSVKAGCKFLVASSFSAQFTPLARPNYKHGWPRTASEAERQSICSKKRTWCCCYRRWHYHLVVVNQWQNSGSTKKANTDGTRNMNGFFLSLFWGSFRFFAHGKMVFALLKVLERNLIGKAPFPPTIIFTSIAKVGKTWISTSAYILYGQNLSFVQVLFRYLAREGGENRERDET